MPIWMPAYQRMNTHYRLRWMLINLRKTSENWRDELARHQAQYPGAPERELSDAFNQPRRRVFGEDIAREINTLRKDSIYLSKALIHVHIRSAQPGGVDFRVDLPGEYGYESKRDDELYRKLDGNLQRFQWQEFQKTIREKYPESEETDAEKDANADTAAETAADSTK